MNILSHFDLLHPLDGLFGRLLHGPMHRFAFRADAGFSGLQVEMILRQYGIRVWGREMSDSHERALLVKETQAIWAEYILCRAGVPLTTPLLDARNAHYRNLHEDGAMPKPWSVHGIGSHSIVDRIVDAVERLTG